MKVNTAEIIMQLEDDIYTDYNVTSKPQGTAWLLMVLDLAKLITEEVQPADITPEVLDELTAGNFHTARHAAEIVLQLSKYML